MRILVTGGAGFIGSHIVDAYLAEGHEVAVVDNLATGRRASVNKGAKLHEVDIHSREVERVFAEFKPEVVNHHAAQASVKVSTGDPVFDLEINGGGTARIASLCVEHGVRKLIYASSGGTVYGEPAELPVPETHPTKPVSNYGLSKLVGELYIELMARTAGLDYTNLRYSNAYGPRQDPNGEAGVVAIFTGRMLAGEQCTIDGDGEQRKDYVYVGDIARANVLCLERGNGATLNIGTGQGTSVNEIYRALDAATGNTIAARNGPPRPGDVRNFWLDTTRAQEVLGWRPEVIFEDGIRTTVASFKED
ncbi:MAG: NAD-dependent epimerase/dehydratase family protein [Dehalococcoidia bacterium]|nr:NAD-dependent epimerase/dehydratase family protein [Dehalococcoidia bacterium]